MPENNYAGEQTEITMIPGNPQRSMELAKPLQVDALGSKVDKAVKHGLTINQVLSMDNHQAGQLDLDNPASWNPLTRDFIGSNPLIASIYGKKKHIDGLNDLAANGDDYKYYKTVNEGVLVNRRSIYGDHFAPKTKLERDILKARGWISHGLYYTNKYDPKQRRFVRPVIGDAERTPEFNILGISLNSASAKIDYTREQAQKLFNELKFEAVGDNELKQFNEIAGIFEDAKKKLQFLSYIEKENPDWRGLPDEVIENTIKEFSSKYNVNMNNIRVDAFRRKGASWWNVFESMGEAFPGNSELEKQGKALSRIHNAVSTQDVNEMRELVDDWITSATGRTGMGNIQEGIAQSAPYMMHFLIGSGIASMGKGAALAMVKNPQNLNKFVRGAVGAMGSSTALTATAFQDQIAHDIEAEGTFASFDGKGQYTVKNSDLSSNELFLKNSILTWTSVLTEYSGGALKHIPWIGKYLSRGVAKLAKGKGITAKAINAAVKLSRRTQGKVAFDGLWGEFFEEGVDHTGQFLLTETGRAAGIDMLSSINVDSLLMDKQELKTTAGVIAIQSGFFGAPAGVARIANLKALSAKDASLRALHERITKTPELKESKQMLKGFIREGIGDTSITVNARALQSAFQDGRIEMDIKEALGLDQTTDELIKSQAEANGSVYIEADKLLVDSASPEVFNAVMDLAEDIPGGTTLQQFAEFANSKPELTEQDKKQVNEITESEKAYRAKLDEYTQVLKEHKNFSPREAKLGMQLFDSMVTTLADRADIEPQAIIEDLQARNISYDDFVQGYNGNGKFQAAALSRSSEAAGYYPEGKLKADELFISPVVNSDMSLPVIETDTEISDGTNKYQARENARKYLKQMQGMQFKNNHTGWLIDLSSAGIKKDVDDTSLLKSLNDINHFNAVKVLPQLIENAALVASHGDRDNDININAMHRLFVPLRIGDKFYRVKLTIKDLTHGESGKFYSHELQSLKIVEGGELAGISLGLVEPPVKKPSSSSVKPADTSKEQAQLADKDIKAGSIKISDLLKDLKPESIIGDKNRKVKSFYQDKRGAFSLSDSNEKIISLFENARLDTFAHESFHFISEAMRSLRDNGVITDTQLLSDIEYLENYETEEIRAQAFEKYLKTGKAPNSKLKSMFNAFRRILTKIYAFMKNNFFYADVEVSEELREVFDRMVTNEAQAEDYIKDEQFFKMLNYYNLNGLGAKDKRGLSRILDSQKQAVVDGIEKQKTKERPAIRKAARAEAAEAMKEMPVYSVWDDLKKRGAINNLDARAMNLSNNQMRLLVAKGAVSKDKSQTNADAGIISELAAKNGYESARDMIDDLVKYPAPHKFEQFYVKQRMQEFEERFMESSYLVETENAVKQLEDMIKVLGAKAGSKKEGAARYQKSLKILRSEINIMLNKKSVRELVDTSRPLDAIRNNSRDAMLAMQQKKWDKAFELVQSVRYQVEELKQKRQKKEAFGKAIKEIKKLAKMSAGESKKSRIWGASLHHIQKLALAYGIVDHAPRVVSSEKLENIFERFGGAYSVEQLPVPRDFRELSGNEFQALADVMEFLHLIGSEVVQRAEAELKEQRIENVETARSILSKGKKVKLQAENVIDKVTIGLHGFRFLGKNTLAICRQLDGYINAIGNKGAGFFEKTFYHKISNASSNEAQLIYTAQETALPAIKHLNVLKKKFTDDYIAERLNVRVPSAIQRMGNKHWDFEMLVSVLLNLGTEDNYQKLQDGYAVRNPETGEITGSELGPAEINQIVSLFDRGEDWDAIETLWRAVETILPAKKAAHQAVTYTELKEVPKRAFEVAVKNEAGEVETRTIDGGYYHIAYDGNMDQSTQLREKELDLQSGAHSTGKIMNPTGGDTKERMSFTGKPVKLDFSVFENQLYESAHNAAFRELARDLGGILSDNELQLRLREKLGNNGAKAFNELITSSVNPQRNTSRILRTLDGIVTAKALWFNLTSALMQHAGVSQGITAIGKDAFMKAQMNFYKSPKEAIDFVNRKSIFMRDRQKGADYDLRRESKNLKLDSAAQKLEYARQVGFIGIRIMDSLASYPVWTAAYSKMISENKTDAEASAYADRLIAETQGTGRNIDKVWGQHLEGTKHFLKFFSAVSAFSNRQSTVYRGWKAGTVSNGEYANFVISELVAPALYSGFLRLLGGGGLIGYVIAGLYGDDDEFEKKQNELARQYITESVSFGFQGIPFVRDVGDVVLSKMLGTNSFAKGNVPVLRPVVDFMGGVGKATKAVKGTITGDEKTPEYWFSAIDSAVTIGTDLTRVPLATAVKRIKRSADRASQNDEK